MEEIGFIKSYPANFPQKFSQVFKFFNIEISVALHKELNSTSFFIQKRRTKDDYIFINYQIFQKIRFNNKVRFAHHSRHQTLKKN